MKDVSTYIKLICIFVIMITLYELVCPMTRGVVYVGITKDIKTRYFAHVWGSRSDSNEKQSWCAELKEKGVTPILKIKGEFNCNKQAKKMERVQIVKRINEGCGLFNIVDDRLYYQYTPDGTLVNIFHTLREIKAETGISVNLDRYTSGGYVWTIGSFDKNKPKKLKESRQVLCKKVGQFTKDGKLVAEYKGVREACRQTGIDHRSISQVASGSKIRKSAGGYKWKYIT